MEYEISNGETCLKGDNTVTVSKKIKETNERYVVVVDDGKPVGIISPLDIVEKVVAEGKNPLELTAEDIMSSPLIIHEKGEPLEQAYAKMVSSNKSMIPIVENEKYMGLLTFNEAVRCLTVKYKDQMKGEKNVNQ